MYMAEGRAAQLSILTLGDCYILSSGRTVSHPINYFRILTYVLLEGRGKPVLRRRIGDLIWSDSGSEQASADSRQAIARIRRFQEDNGFELLVSDPQSVWLNADRRAYFDLAEFVQLIAKPTPAAWMRMCEIYNGDLLASLRTVGEGFEEWLAYQRSAIRHDFISTISQAVEPDSALSAQQRHYCASRLLQVDPYNEGAHRALMYDAAANGQYSVLRQLYEECTRRLRNELGVDPDEETVRLYNRLLNKARSA